MAGWIKATLGSAVAAGDPIMVWCANVACGYRLESGREYRAILTPADLAAYAEKYGGEHCRRSGLGRRATAASGRRHGRPCTHIPLSNCWRLSARLEPSLVI
jgi:hypothetical protein